MELIMKYCRICERSLPVENYSKHSSSRDKLDSRCKECMKDLKRKSKEKDSNEYPILPIDMNNTEWQVGKPIGSILYREDPKTKSKRYEVRVPLGGGKLKSKSFALDKYESEEVAKQHATNWLHEFSKENHLTRNMIKVLDENTIEVQLTKGKTMKTDIDFADICQKYSICTTKSSSEYAQYYACITINNNLISFHKHITGNVMTDHINRDPLDNRLANLRKTTHKLNNNNRGVNKKYENDPNHILGVRYNKKDESWQARIKQDGKEFTKSFSIKKFGNKVAKELAIVTRTKLNEEFHCSNN